MHSLIPLWIIVGPFIGLWVLSFSFGGRSAMGGTAPRLPPRAREPVAPPAPLFDPLHPNAPRRIV